MAIVPRGWDAGAIETIGVGYDGSVESEAALSAACQVARRFGAAVRVIRVFDTSHFAAPALTTVPGWETVQKDYEAERRETLERAVAALPPDVSAEAVFVTGSAGRVLAAQSELVDLMVVGSRGYGPPDRRAARRRDPHADPQGGLPGDRAAARLARARALAHHCDGGEAAV